MRRYLVVSVVALTVLLLILSCAKPKRTNPYDPGNPDRGILTGRVTDTGGAPISGARVTTDPAPATSDNTTDSSGNYQLVGLLPGSYKAIVSAASYDTVQYDITITAGQTTTLNPQLSYNGGGPNRGWIEGYVLKTDTTAVSGAWVTAIRAAFTDSNKTTAVGFYRIPSLLPDTYRVVVRAAPPPAADSTYVLPVARDTIVVSPNQRTPLNFTLFRWVWWNFNNDTVGNQAQGWTSTRGVWQVSDTIPGAKAYLGVDTDGQGGFTAPTLERKCNAFSLTLSVFIPGSSPPPQAKVEVFFHIQPSLSHYLAVIVDSGTAPSMRKIRLYKVVSNSPQLLASHDLPSFTRDNWHLVQVSDTSQVIELKVDGTRYIQQSDATFPVGGIRLGVTGATGALAFFDNLSLVY